MAFDKKAYQKAYQKAYRVKNKEICAIYRKNNKEEKAIYDKEYRKNNKEKKKKDDRDYYEKNQERLKEKQRIYGQSAEVKEQRRIYSQKHYQANREKRLKEGYEWRAKNRERSREIAKQSSIKNREQLIELMKCMCKACGENDPIYLQFDHVYNDGYLDRKTGANGQKLPYRSFRLTVKKYLENPKRFQLLCANCNQAKKNNGGKLYKPKKRKPSAKRNKRQT